MIILSLQKIYVLQVLTCDISLLVRISDTQQGGPLLSTAGVSLGPG